MNMTWLRNRSAFKRARSPHLVAGPLSRTQLKSAMIRNKGGHHDADELPKEQPRSGFNLTSQGYLIRILISIGPKFGEHLVHPMPSIMATPDSSVDEPACNGSTREEDGPQVPCLRPG